jgi:hypothetical protein
MGKTLFFNTYNKSISFEAFEKGNDKSNCGLEIYYQQIPKKKPKEKGIRSS